jgi:Concanavalin A-like lectin/glucanases superfamily
MNTKQSVLTTLALAVSLAGANAQQWSTNTLPTGLVGWWAAEGTATDGTGNHHDGTVSGGVSYLAGRYGSGFAFDGISGVVEVPDSSALRLTSALSLEFWAKRQRYAIDLVLEKGGDWNLGSESNYGAGLHSINNRMFYFIFRGGWRGTSGVADFNWHHYTVTAANGAANPVLYIDGVSRPIEFSAGAAKLNLYPSLRPLHLGAQMSPGWNYYGNNLLDDVRIYNRELAAAEVSYLYSGAPPPTLLIRLASPSLVTVSWASLTGKTYQLQSVTSLPALIWPNEGSAFAGIGDILTTNIPIAATPTRFFRLEVGN